FLINYFYRFYHDLASVSHLFEMTIFIEKCLVPQLWSGAVVVMDNLPAHKVDSIKSMIESVGASILCFSPYSRLF
ncbi:hypothetical protein QUA40_22690, partial [Microcoleus sp. Pol11C3]